MNEPNPKGNPSSINPVIFDANLTGRLWVASDMKLSEPAFDGSQAIVETTGFKQWLYAGFGYAWQVILPSGEKQWTTSIMGNCYIMKESTTKEQHQ